MGPLGQLWQALDAARKAEEPSAIRITDLLDLAEKAIFLTGQATVSVRHTRRLEVLSGLVKHSEAEKLLKRYDKKCPKAGQLFGKSFRATCLISTPLPNYTK
jgi:ribosomal silencing factor RsfS